MEAEVIPTSRKLHCYEMLSLQYLQDHEVALWQELCHYLMGTPTTSRKRRTQELKADSECQDDYDIEVIPEQSNAEDIFVPSYKVPAIPIQLWPSIKRKLPNFCFDEETWYLFVLLKRNPFRLQKFIDKKSRTDCDFDHRNLLSSYLSTYNFTELHLDCLYRGPGDIIPLPKEIFTFCVNVKLLSLKNNYLESLPADIGRMSNLQKLYLTNNRLQNRGIPYTLQFLKKLNELYLDNNLLDALPSFLLAMKSLHTVHRHGNHNYFKSTFMWYHRFTDVNDRILEVPATNENPCPNCDIGEGDRPIMCWRCIDVKKDEVRLRSKQPYTLQYLCGLSLASGRFNFFHGDLLPSRLKNQLSEQMTQLNLCGHCPSVKRIGDSGFKIFTFKNPYLGNTCVPFIHWACSYKCAQAIEVPARKQQLSSAKEQDRIYNKYVRKSLDDLLQTSGTNSTPSSRSGRFRQRSPQNYCSNHFSTLLANDPFDNVSTSSSQEIRFSECNDLETVSFPDAIARSNSLTEHSERSSIGAMENEFGTRNNRNGFFIPLNDGVAVDHNLETDSLDSIPYELDSSFNSHSARGCGKYLNCSIL